MLEPFKRGSCRRSCYFAILALLLGFDFAKDPIEGYLAALADDTKRQIYASEAPRLQEIHETMLAELKAGSGGGTPQGGRPAMQEEIGRHGSEMIATAMAMEARTTAVGSAHVTALVILGLITLVAMIWMVFARVRDIGWPAWIGFAVLSPALLIRLFGSDMPAPAFDAVQYGFIAALFALGLVPGGFGRHHGTARIDPPQRTLRPPTQAAPGQFGKRR